MCIWGRQVQCDCVGMEYIPAVEHSSPSSTCLAQLRNVGASGLVV